MSDTVIFRVGPLHYTFEMVDGKVRSDDGLGYAVCDHLHQTFKVSRLVPPRKTLWVIVHEFVHAWQKAHPIMIACEEEQLCNWVATLVISIVEDVFGPDLAELASSRLRGHKTLKDLEEAAKHADAPAAKPQAQAVKPAAKSLDAKAALDGLDITPWLNELERRRKTLKVVDLGDGRRIVPLASLDVNDVAVPPSGNEGICQCGRCDKLLAPTQVVTTELKETALGFVCTRVLHCGGCRHLQSWQQEADENGVPGKAVLSPPTYITDRAALEEFLIKHPEAVEVDL